MTLPLLQQYTISFSCKVEDTLETFSIGKAKSLGTPTDTGDEEASGSLSEAELHILADLIGVPRIRRQQPLVLRSSRSNTRRSDVCISSTRPPR